MPLVGEKSRFAIEYYLEDDSEGEWLLGRVCYWCGGERVGDMERITSLRDFLFIAQRIEGDAGNRSNPRFDGMSAARVCEFLAAAMFGRDADSDHWVSLSELAADEQWARHNVDPSIEAFNDWRVFLVENTSMGRLITLHFPSKIIRESILGVGEFDRVLSVAASELNRRLELTGFRPT